MISVSFGSRFIRRGFDNLSSNKTEYSETSAYKIQKPENYPEESIQHSEHGESLKSRTKLSFQIVISLLSIGPVLL